jgi:flagellar M-ring protein FliF
MPGMTIDQVTVLNTDGMILSATDGDASEAVPGKTLALEKSVAKDIQDNIRRTLTPYLRLPNFQVSVRARVNTDRRQINETIYDPESKVERSTRTVKEASSSQNASSSSPTTVERNIPQNQPQGGDGKQSTDENKKSEELTNYEVSTKTVTTVSGGYNIENIAIAVLINRSALSNGKNPPSAEDVERQVREIEQIVASSAGIRKERGDVLKVSAVEFTFNEHEMSPMEAPGIMESLSHYLGTVINAVTVLIITALLVFFGLVPATRALLAEAPAVERAEPPPLLADGAGGGGDEEGGAPGLLPQMPMEPPVLALNSDLDGFSGITGLGRPSPRQRLEELIEADEMQAASVLKRWMRSDEAA